MMKRAFLAGALLIVCVGCSPHDTASNPTPTPSPSAQPIEIALDQEMTAIDSVELRQTVRDSTTQYLKTNHPDWKIQGLSLTHYAEDADYFIAADIMDGSTSRIVQLKAWLFVKDNGETYWKIAPE
jgi:hypothetical protein